jgi:hypothetical protein
MADDPPAYVQFLRTLLLLPLNAEKLAKILKKLAKMRAAPFLNNTAAELPEKTAFI